MGVVHGSHNIYLIEPIPDHKNPAGVIHRIDPIRPKCVPMDCHQAYVLAVLLEKIGNQLSRHCEVNRLVADGYGAGKSLKKPYWLQPTFEHICVGHRAYGIWICPTGNMTALGWSFNCRELSWVLQCGASPGWLWLHPRLDDSSYMCETTPTTLKSTRDCAASSAAQLQYHWCELCPWATDVTYIPYKMSIRIRFTPKDMGWYL